MLELGGFRIDLINDGVFEDDADTFVRLCLERQMRTRVPKRSRIRVGFNSLLARGRGHVIVVDPGAGDKLRPDLVQRYRMEWPRRFLPSLAAMNLRPEDVDTVILTHLHWDHCGAATRIREDGALIPTFPRAKYFVQRRELEAARDGLRSGDDGYLADDFEPLVETGHLNLLDGDTEILPGVAVRWTGGHTAGHQVVLFGDTDSPQAVYLSDAVPTSAQIPLDCALSYDRNIEELKAAKRRLLPEAAERGDLLLFVHAPRLRAGRLIRRSDGTFQLSAVEI
jgi:glyoxylase-like metal-dependent hydrolase (beta-lactamase superfamily II)